MPPENILIRAALLADIPEILRQRRSMYKDMHHTDSVVLDAVVSLSSAYLKTAMADGSFRAWLAAEGAA